MTYLILSDDNDKAIADFTKAIELRPDVAQAYNNRGNVYTNKGDFGKALEDLNKAIEIDPNYANAYNNRASIHMKMQNYDQSWEDVHKAEALGVLVEPKVLEELKKVSGRTS